MGKYKDEDHSSYVRIARCVLFRCPEWRQLSARAKIFYLYLKAKYNGPSNRKGHITNNGSIQLHFSELKDLPELKSRKAFYGAARELEASGWIKKTNPERSGLFRNPNTYRLTWQHDKLE